MAKLEVAMPIAHETTGGYGSYYQGGQSIYQVVNYFGKGTTHVSEGLQIRANPLFVGGTDDAKWRLYAFTNGFLSLQTVTGNPTLLLRLPSEFSNADAPAHAYNSSQQFLRVNPLGPQLRHVSYVFDQAPGDDVEDAIRAILTNPTHPGRTISRVANATGQGTTPLGEFLAASTANLDSVVASFMAGRAQLFVRAGDIIGNFRTRVIDLRFLDSCGPVKPELVTDAPIFPIGRAINPAYYLYLVRRPANAGVVSLLTKFDPGPAQSHPLDYLLSPTVVTSGGGNPAHPPDYALDHTAGHPPAPRLITVPVKDAAGQTIAGRGIPMNALAWWHQSRNAANQFASGTTAPIQWRHYGSPSEDIRANWGKLVSIPKSGRADWLPNGANFARTFPPDANHTSKVATYWDRYHLIFNVVADRFEIPCEILLAIACSESSSDEWVNTPFDDSLEMDVIRMEPMDNPSPGLQKEYDDAQSARANATIPIPWNGSTAVHFGSINPPNDALALTWENLRTLVATQPVAGKVSPGLMQTVVSTALDDFRWLVTIYGAGAVPALTITHNNVALTAAAPPNTCAALFKEWFGVSVDTTGRASSHPSHDSSHIDQELTKMQRAFHSIIAGAAHVKHFYNGVEGNLATLKNLVSDFDFPTVASAYNDRAREITATATINDTKRWKQLFGIRFYDDKYPRNGTGFFNAAVALFNTTTFPAPKQPSVRLWKWGF